MSVNEMTDRPGTFENDEQPRRRTLSWIAGGVATAGLVTALTVAMWPGESEADKARDDGERLGQAVTDLYHAENQAEVDAAMAEIDSAVADTREHATSNVVDHVEDQVSALASAVDGYIGYYTTDSEWDALYYDAEFSWAVDEFEDNAEQFRTEGPEVQQAFWEGFQDGLSIDDTEGTQGTG